MNRHEHYKRLSCPVRDDWHAFVAYEGTWDRHLCEPDPEPVGVYLQRMVTAEARVSWLEFQMHAARSTLSPRFGR